MCQESSAIVVLVASVSSVAGARHGDGTRGQVQIWCTLQVGHGASRNCRKCTEWKVWGGFCATPVPRIWRRSRSGLGFKFSVQGATVTGGLLERGEARTGRARQAERPSGMQDKLGKRSTPKRVTFFRCFVWSAPLRFWKNETSIHGLDSGPRERAPVISFLAQRITRWPPNKLPLLSAALECSTFLGSTVDSYSQAQVQYPC